MSVVYPRCCHASILDVCGDGDRSNGIVILCRLVSQPIPQAGHMRTVPFLVTLFRYHHALNSVRSSLSSSAKYHLQLEGQGVPVVVVLFLWIENLGIDFKE